MTQVITKQEALINDSVEQFKLYARKSAQNYLEMGRVVYETRESLAAAKSQDGFELFCSKLGHTSKSKTMLKMAQIGKSYPNLIKHIDSLPDGWTTIYEIARLSPEQIEQFVQSGAIHPNVLGVEVKALTKKPSAAKNPAPVTPCEILDSTESVVELGMICVLEKSINETVLEELRRIITELRIINVTVSFTDELEHCLYPNLRRAA